ncbi:ribosome maturation factor RimP [Lactococcus nasutitermitis]|uniref:Ribosome maturation factor RimP n=1 Tax=Lactococcus nasutitermitis TaxID=1652957 RepID=A0ABV9JA40_9LACT|nr:ribosome maturation factor RimP [Lactococcus nasutitermitis]
MEEITKVVETFIEPYLPEDVELVDVEWEKLGQDFILRVVIDKVDGVSIEDTANLSEIISPLLDKISPDPFPSEGYMLEVVSPGAERPLKKLADFENALGAFVLIKLYQKIAGEKEFTGDIVKVNDEVITLDVLDKTRHKSVEIPLDKISKATTLVKF